LFADLPIFRDAMPRSRTSCYENLVLYPDHIARAYGRQGPAQRQARAVRARIQNSRLGEIFQSGLHEFIGEFIGDNNRLGAAITEQYLMERTTGNKAGLRPRLAIFCAPAMRLRISHL